MSVDTRPSIAVAGERATKPPSVLVILVTRDGGSWLRACLRSLSVQTHPRMSVLAVDNASTDGSADVLETALGPDHVLRLDHNVGFPGAVAAAFGSDAVAEADYILLLHDDTMLAPAAIARMVETALRIDDAGVVGPKVLDWDEPRVLREIGQSTDRFGYPYSPLEDGEIDHGQYDRVREVMFVSSCAMLVSKRAWNRVGTPDERLGARHDDLDFCWRARLAGFRVLVTPAAVARHLGATIRHRRAETREAPDRTRYHRERAALASMLKNYGLLSLVWILPMYLMQGTARIATLTLSRRFEDAWQMLAAWWWNLAHLPGTIRRRARAQAVRVVADRHVHRYMAPAGIRVRRWVGQILEPVADAGAVGKRAPLHRRLARFLAVHPVAVAWGTACLVALLAYRGLLAASPLTGGAMPTFPATAGHFFHELVSGLRSTGLGGAEPASPALGFLGLASLATFGSPALLQKLLLLGLPAAAAVGVYRSVKLPTGSRVAGAVGGATYGLSAVVLWALSQGRLAVLVFLAGVPWVTRKLSEAFDPGLVVGRRRWIAGAALGLAGLAAFYPGVALPALLVAVAGLVFPDRAGARSRGLILVILAGAAAAVLAFPITATLARTGGAGLSDSAGIPSLVAALRLAPGPAPGSWLPGLYIPVAAAVAAVVVSARWWRVAARAGVVAVAAVYLAWLAAAGALPPELSNPVAYLGLAGASFATLIGLGVASVTGGVREASFGLRQLGAAVLAGILVYGLGAQAVAAVRGGWEVGGPELQDPTYLALADAPDGPSRVVWLGRPSADHLPWPGGVPDGEIAAGRASARYGVTGAAGASSLDVARPAVGPGYDALETALSDILSGRTRHGGALLAPAGVRFVVGRQGDLPEAVLNRLQGQVDLDRVPSGALLVFRNAKAVPLSAALEDEAWADAAITGELVSLPVPRAERLEGSGKRLQGWAGPDTTLVLLSQQFDEGWELVAADRAVIEADPAFGWAVGFAPPGEAGPFEVGFGGQARRDLEIAALAALWALGVWMTRRPTRGR